MLSQTATEAMLSATYVENYLDCVENLPNDVQRYLSRMRELDVTYREHVRDSEKHLAVALSPNTGEKRRVKAALRLQASLVSAQEIGDEKLQLVQALQDLIDNKQRALDADKKKLVACLEVNTNGGSAAKKEPSPPVEPEPEEKEDSPVEEPDPTPPPPERSVEKEKEKVDKEKFSGERWSKRARRSRNNAGGKSDGADSSERDSERPTSSHTHKKGIGKKKKRKARQAAQRSETEENDAIDPDEPRYCLCDQISFGEMILCDNDLCPIGWFHFSCVSLSTKPKGKWFCPKCRGDRPNIMKPKGQFLKELERYNREKEEKA